MEFITKSAGQTQKLGKKIANNIVRSTEYKVHRAVILALTGDLGSGKTTFVQGFAQGLGIKQRIISPTFILLRKYQIPDTRYQIQFFYHLDLYRLEENMEKEVRNLGVEDVWKDPKNIVIIEWAEKIKQMIPKDAKWIKFENLGGEKRKISIE